MRPLSEKTKSWLYSRLALGPASRFARPAYDRLIDALVVVRRHADALGARDTGDVSRVTAVIKTFERPYALERLVSSVRRLYPTLRIIVVDDSRVPAKVEGVHFIAMPFDSGLSAGRNRALEEVATPYFILLDDDFLFSSRQRISEWVSFLDRHPEVDILGGACIDLPLFSVHKQARGEIFPSPIAPKLPLGTTLEQCEVVDKVPNFFIARTAPVKDLGWDPALKLLEHADFFLRARGKLVTAYHPDMFVHHVKYPFDVRYLRYRWRTPDQF